MDTSAPISSSKIAFSLLIFPVILACRNHFPGEWCFQYPRDSPGSSVGNIVPDRRISLTCGCTGAWISAIDSPSDGLNHSSGVRRFQYPRVSPE
ncbi:hypothetical protein PR002_g32699 [Phytophthora rubi]|uniref:Secreted protein n=1 Tax=Phytophthora rubi TaxID=129364 RepID=A0A6A3G6M2_9STRA|nr:hypothetical protein PR002_g32699 [Phytophthora rubi]